jgi:hypothetical protein
MSLIPGWFGGSSALLSVYVAFGIGTGAATSALIMLVFGAFPAHLPYFMVSGSFIGAIAGGWFYWSHLNAAYVPTAIFPGWMLVMFPISLAWITLGLLSALYILLEGVSLIALAGAYLIPIGLMTLNYVLKAAERQVCQ